MNKHDKIWLANVDLNFLKDEYDDDFDDCNEHNIILEVRKYLVVIYKIENINTYNVFVFDIKTK